MMLVLLTAVDAVDAVDAAGAEPLEAPDNAMIAATAAELSPFFPPASGG